MSGTKTPNQRQGSPPGTRDLHDPYAPGVGKLSTPGVGKSFTPEWGSHLPQSGEVIQQRGVDTTVGTGALFLEPLADTLQTHNTHC